jgi:hypothetical protein
MTSRRQLRANRLNALRSTGPRSPQGKLRSRNNALRHGLTAETIISVLEDAAEYEAFQASVRSEYPDRSLIESELVSRLASILWRLRRATAIEGGLFQIQSMMLGAADGPTSCHPAVDMAKLNRALQLRPKVPALLLRPSPAEPAYAEHQAPEDKARLAQCFLEIAKLPSYPFDRISRYETSLWKQAQQIIHLLGTGDVRTKRAVQKTRKSDPSGTNLLFVTSSTNRHKSNIKNSEHQLA